MIKISDRVYLASHAIKSIRHVSSTEDDALDYILVTTFDGESYQAEPESWQGLSSKLDELVAAVRADSGLES